MRCNQVTIKIERFGKYVPEGYRENVGCSMEVYTNQ